MLVPVAEKVGTTPTTAALVESLRVIVTADVADPSARTGPVALMDEFRATADPDSNTTVPPVLTTGVAIAKVFVSPVVEARVQVEIPPVFDEEQVSRVLLDPVEVKVGTTPDTGFELASLSVIVMVEVEIPSGFTGPEPVMLDVAASTIPAVKTIAGPAFTIGVAIDGILLSAFVDLSVQVAMPEASVAEQAV